MRKLSLVGREASSGNVLFEITIKFWKRLPGPEAALRQDHIPFTYKSCGLREETQAPPREKCIRQKRRSKQNLKLGKGHQQQRYPLSQRGDEGTFLQNWGHTGENLKELCESSPSIPGGLFSQRAGCLTYTLRNPWTHASPVLLHHFTSSSNSFP